MFVSLLETVQVAQPHRMAAPLEADAGHFIQSDGVKGGQTQRLAKRPLRQSQIGNAQGANACVGMQLSRLFVETILEGAFELDPRLRIPALAAEEVGEVVAYGGVVGVQIDGAQKMRIGRAGIPQAFIHQGQSGHGIRQLRITAGRLVQHPQGLGILLALHVLDAQLNANARIAGMLLHDVTDIGTTIRCAGGQRGRQQTSEQDTHLQRPA